MINGVYLAAILVLASVIWGGWPERVGFVILLLMLGIQLSLHTWLGAPRFESVEIPVLVADLFGFVGFTALMRRAERSWTIFAWTMSAFSLVGHFSRATGDMMPISYANFESLPTVLILLTLPIAVLAHRWRLKTRGFDRAWTPLRTDKSLRKATKRVALEKNYRRG